MDKPARGESIAAWQARVAHERKNPSVPPGFSSSFTGFDFFDDVPEEDTPPLSETRQTLRAMKRGDVVTVGRTRWAVMRVLGDLQALVYKHPSEHKKLYELRLEGDDDVVVFEVGGSGRRVSEDVASGPLRATGETVDL